MIRYEALDGATVCICAPARASWQVADLELRLALAGASVLAPAPAGRELSPIERASLAALHLRKIEAADAVVVANSGGYTGAGTASEIAHALRLGTPVHLADDAVELETDPATYEELVSRTASIEVRPASQFPARLTRGSLVSVFAPKDGRGRCAWFRIGQVLGFPGRMQAAVALDTARVRAGMDVDDLLAHLDREYPGEDDQPFTALELEFVAELGELAHPVAPRRPGAVRLLARNEAGEVALTPGSVGRLELPNRRLAPRQHPAQAAEQLARDLFGGQEPAVRLAALDTEVSGITSDAQIYACDLGHLDAAAAGEAASEHGLVFTSPAQGPTRADPWTARVIDAHLTRGDATGVLVLEDGYLPGHRTTWQWFETDTPPQGVPVTQAGVWAIDRDGRSVLQHRVDQGRFALPAGSPEPDDRDWLATAAREAFEESQILIDQSRARLIGFQVTYADPAFPNGLAQARFVAPLLGYLPIAPDTDPKLTAARPAYRRYLADLRHAARLLGWGPHADAQIRAAEQAALEIGLPVDRPAGDDYRDHGDPELAEMPATWNVLL
ncbi:NUDIX hydrolase [Actinospica sp. MGRD01-02]|uniref:NUDIX hydrolase n=1 Tax=Actinospica acidithermotolerans TaxID=2828514 RepID=A0A941IJF6_9ACTN|nr:NUDIX hydrolase [Actinospica acidithermotolerans]MBR7827817.1 NUDIX hydrolase [Actinospica acidithermotolerans]